MVFRNIVDSILEKPEKLIAVYREAIQKSENPKERKPKKSTMIQNLTRPSNGER